MKKLLNTLYITTPKSYLSLDGENVVITKEDKTVMRVPLHNMKALLDLVSLEQVPLLWENVLIWGYH